MQKTSRYMLVIGGATLDTIITYKDMEAMEHRREKEKSNYLLLPEGKKIEVLDMHVASGGAGTNTAVAFHKQGLHVLPFCKLGDDIPAATIIDELKAYGINTKYMQRIKNICSGNSYIIPALSGDRTIFAYRGANATLLTHEIPNDLIQHASGIHISSLSHESSKALPGIVKKAAEHHIHVSVNPGNSQITHDLTPLHQSLPYIDIVSLNEEEALIWQQFARKQDRKITIKTLPKTIAHWPEPITHICYQLEFFMSMMLQNGPKILIITLGDLGVVVITTQNIYYHPCQKQKVVNTLGAGDAFIAGFIGAIEYQLNIEQAIAWGISNSASVVQYKDAKAGLLTKQQLMQAGKKILASDLMKKIDYKTG